MISVAPISPAYSANVSTPAAAGQGVAVLAAANASANAALELVQTMVYELSLQSSARLVQGPALGTRIDTYA